MVPSTRPSCIMSATRNTTAKKNSITVQWIQWTTVVSEPKVLARVLPLRGNRTARKECELLPPMACLSAFSRIFWDLRPTSSKRMSSNIDPSCIVKVSTSCERREADRASKQDRVYSLESRKLHWRCLHFVIKGAYVRSPCSWTSGLGSKKHSSISCSTCIDM